MFYKFCATFFVIFFCNNILFNLAQVILKRNQYKTMQIYFICVINFKWTQDLRPQYKYAKVFKCLYQYAWRWRQCVKVFNILNYLKG